jgi:hypothetical protein
MQALIDWHREGAAAPALAAVDAAASAKEYA